MIITENHYKTFNFSGGEIHVEFFPSVIAYLNNPNKTDTVVFDIKLISSDKIVQLLLLNDIVQRAGFKTACNMMYIPYGRQDRATINYGPASLKVFANLINSCNFEYVKTIDPHSIVSEAVIDNLKITSTAPHILNYIKDVMPSNDYNKIVFLAPDLGAVKRVETTVKQMQIGAPILISHKQRNPQTGEITDIKLIGDMSEGKQVFVIDDICDGGRTFTELLDKTKLHHKNDVHLWVTHGIFSKGDKVLFDAGYTTVGTTDSVRSNTLNLNTKVKMFYL